MSWYSRIRNAVAPAKKTNKSKRSGTQKKDVLSASTVSDAQPALPESYFLDKSPAPATQPAQREAYLPVEAPTQPTKESTKQIKSSFKYNAVQKLSAREKEVFLMSLEGAKMKDMASVLHIKTSTVNGYCREIYRKLNVNSKPQLILQYSHLKRYLVKSKPAGNES